MGTHSIVAVSDEKAGATISKVERYDEFFAGYAQASARLTFYGKSYPDQWPAEVLFLVRKAGRRNAVNAAIIFGLRDRIEPTIRLTADSRNLNLLTAWSPENPSNKSWISNWALQIAFRNGGV